MLAHARHADRSSQFAELSARAWHRNAPLTAMVVAMLALLAVSIVGVAVDPRVITGAPAWLKPAKFATSIAIYGATLLWLLQFLSDRPRLVKAVGWLVAAGLTTEMILIAMQVIRGTTSHFNEATPFDSTVFHIMAGVIAAIWLLNLFVAILLFRRQFAAPSLVWGVRMGVIAALLGMAVAFLMPQPTPAQEQLKDATGSSPIVGAHSVGVADGGPGLPVVGWSTVGGDLRVPHFVGLHGLQMLPFVGWLLASFAPTWLSARARAQLAIVAGIAWIALLLLLTWQALRAQPLIAPDSLTHMGFTALVAVAGALAAVVIAREAGTRATRGDALPLRPGAGR
jgi:hypothetical protein